MGHLQGKKTVISNFSKIIEVLGREQQHVLKYLLKELATPGEVRGNLLVLGAKISASMFNQRVREYADEYVLCHDCGKPDTKLLTEAGLLFLKCTACGSRHHVKGKA